MNVRSKKGLTRRGGFTIIELLIVIGVVMALSALVLSGFSNLGANNRRQTCQSNLAQLYQSLRLYQQDEGGFPFLNNGDEIPTSSLQPNIGLWALYAFPQDSDINKVDSQKITGRYVRSAKIFHCPQDADGKELMVGGELNASITSPNTAYLSYQKIDTDSAGQPSYQSIRETSQSDMELWKRQLVTFNGTSRVYRTPADNTVVTWCRFHRPNGRDFDNVLFYDGSVQLISKTKDAVEGWKRTPKPPI